MEKNLLASLTIVIPTYYRSKFLERALKFYLNYNDQFNIIVLDSTPNCTKNGELTLLLKNAKVEYFHYEETIHFAEKVARGLTNIKTEYSVICADDDFLIPNGLNKCIHFLKKNKDYNAVQGICCVHSSKSSISDKSFQMSLLYTKGKSSDRNSSYKRLIDTYYYNIIQINTHYAVFRTTDHAFFWRETANYASNTYSEFFIEAISCIYGKSKILPYFYQSRERNTISWYNNDEFMYKEMHSAKNTNKVMEGVKKHISIAEKISAKKVDLFFKEYPIDPLPEKYKTKVRKKNQLYIFYYYILHYINDKIIRRFSITNLLNYFFHICKDCPPILYSKSLNDFNKVKLSVISANCTKEDLNFSRVKNYTDGFLSYTVQNIKK